MQVEPLNPLGQIGRNFPRQPQAGAIRAQLNVGRLPVGVCFVRLHTAEGTISKRLVET